MARRNRHRVPLPYHSVWQQVATSGNWLQNKSKIYCFLASGRVRGLPTDSPCDGMTTTKSVPSPTNGWLTINEVCSRLTISYDTWAKWRQRGVAPRVARLPNGQLRTREDWLLNFMDNLVELS